MALDLGGGGASLLEGHLDQLGHSPRAVDSETQQFFVSHNITIEDVHITDDQCPYHR